MVQNLSEKVAQQQPFDIYRFTARCTLDMIFATTLGTDMHIQDSPTCTYLEVLEDLIDQLRNVMMKEGSTNHEEDIEHELNTIIFAGNETSAMTVANTILLIAMHPHVQRNLVDEMRTHFGHDVSNIRYETLTKLVYMEMVMKESLRLLPIAAVVGRKTTAEIDVGDYRLPAGVDILIDIFDIHRNPVYWGSDADQFRPERFETINYDRFSFLAFSAGPRNCVGLRYAWISMKIMLLKVLDRYTLETDLKLEELDMKMALTMKIVNGHMMRLKRRQ
uniref:Uncharacterized protein n=1 Tax=Anopheles atroparvus TaxID=41427 RepID=A0A182IN74_ANOAO